MGKYAICAGNVCLDITPSLAAAGAARVEEALQPGKLVEAGRAAISPGGSVTNTGLCMKRLGADVRLMGKIGADALGDLLAGLFEAEGAGGSLIRQAGASTSYSVILAIPGIDRIILHHPGANHDFRADDIPWDAVGDAALMHFGYPTVMRSMYRDDGEELVRLLRRARETGMATSLDTSAIDPESEAGRADWRRILARALPFVDFFEPSVEELCFMLDRERFRAWQARAAGGDVCERLDVDRDIRPLAAQCMAMGPGVLLLKCGAPGLCLRTAPREALRRISPRAGLDPDAWADQDRFEPSYVPDRVVSATGAGDTSIAAFLTAVLAGDGPEWAMHLAAAAGASCVTAADSLSGIPDLQTLETRIRGGWAKALRHPAEA